MTNNKYTYYTKANRFSEGYFESKKSKFYSYIYNVNNIDEIQDILADINKEHKRS